MKILLQNSQVEEYWSVFPQLEVGKKKKVYRNRIYFVMTLALLEIILSNDNIFSLRKPIFIDKEVFFTEMRWRADGFAPCS